MNWFIDCYSSEEDNAFPENSYGPFINIVEVTKILENIIKAKTGIKQIRIVQKSKGYSILKI